MVFLWFSERNSHNQHLRDIFQPKCLETFPLLVKDLTKRLLGGVDAAAEKARQPSALWENHGKTMGKPWENHGKMVIKKRPTHIYGG